MTKIIYKLTPEQEKLISVYQEKWRAIAQSTTPIDRHKAVTTIIDAYNLIGKRTPKVYIYDSPLAIINQIIYDCQHQLNKVHVIQEKLNLLDKVKQIQLILLSTTLILILVTYILTAQLGKVGNHIVFSLFWLLIINLLASVLANLVTIFINFQLHRAIKEQPVKDFIAQQLNVQLSKQPLTEIGNQLDAELLRSLQQEYGSVFDHINTRYMHTKARIAEIIPDWEYNSYIAPERCLYIPKLDIANGSLFDFYYAINCLPTSKTWLIYQSLLQCDWIFVYEEVCYICAHPRKLSFDNQQQLHAEGAPAIEYADGFSVYVHHGVRLPEKYGKIHPQNWQAQWLITEKNAEIRSILLQHIGYEKIYQELQSTEIDQFQEYTLLEIDADIDIEPIQLLKMTCPSTGKIHVLRVPPEILSAREAICWVNWDTDPADFQQQT